MEKKIGEEMATTAAGPTGYEISVSTASDSRFFFHAFVCFSFFFPVCRCDRSLADQEYVAENGQPFCLQCFNQQKAARCFACEKPIGAKSGKVTDGTANGKVFFWLKRKQT